MLQGQQLNKETYTRTLLNSAFFIVAGSHTAATWLTGTLYYLLTNPEALIAASNEVKATFSSAKEMTVANSQSLTYTKACLKEASRVYPPTPLSLPRIVATGGVNICGKYVPAGYTVAVNHWSINRSAANSNDPTAFKPERWLGHPHYQNDGFDALKPWGHGPRTCIAKK